MRRIAAFLSALLVSTPALADTFTVGGTVSGLAGSGLVLQNNAGDDLTIETNGTFTFETALEDEAAYAVTVETQPGTPTQTCTVEAGTGVIATANVTDVAVTCVTDSFTVGGTVSGLMGSGLVLQNNAGDDLTIEANGAFAFATAVLSGAAYAVTVETQPGTPTQTCTVEDGAGTVGGAAVADVAVTCVTDSFDIGGTLVGLEAGSVVLQNNAGDDLTIEANGAFAFDTAVLSGVAYEVTVKTLPTGHTCTVEDGVGTVGGAAVADVAVTCVRTTVWSTPGGPYPAAKAACATGSEPAPLLATDGLSLGNLKGGFSVIVESDDGTTNLTAGGKLLAYAYHPLTGWVRVPDLDLTVKDATTARSWSGFQVVAPIGRIAFVPNGLGAATAVNVYITGR